MKPLIRKSWYPLTEAADYLTRSTEGGPVTVSDVLQLATEGELKLTLRLFSDTFATHGEIILPLQKESDDLTIEDVLEMDLPKPCRVDYVSKQQLEKLKSECELLGTEEVPILFCPWDREFEPDDVAGEELINGGTYWRLTLHGNARDVLQQWWRESYENEEKDWNSIEPKRFLESPGSFELGGRKYKLAAHDPTFFLTPHPYNGDPFFIKIAGSKLPKTTMLGVLSEDIHDLLIGGEPEITTATSSRPNINRQEYPQQLETLILAWERHWMRADPTDRTACPKKEKVVEWLMERGFSAKNADSGATIIKPQWALDKGW